MSEPTAAEATEAAVVPSVPTDPAKEVGQIVLFLDQTESYAARTADFVAAAHFARAHGVDTISPKRADGGIKWYYSSERLAAERAAVLAVGCGYMPYTYCYGPRFGEQQVRDECAILAEIMSVNNHCVCADLESEWNGYYNDATLFDELMRPVPGLLYLTTFGDPRTQNFPIAQIAPCVNCWVPQDYSNWLAAQDSLQGAEGMTVVQPALDLSGEFGPNNVVQISAQMRARGHKALWIWNHKLAQQNPHLLDLVVAAFKG
jgi:hypothetical protein